MINIHRSCLEFGKEKDYINYGRGANISSFAKVADAMLARNCAKFMASVTEDSILNSIKYSETGVIMKCYSQSMEFCLLLCYKGVRSRKRTKFSLSSILEPTNYC